MAWVDLTGLGFVHLRWVRLGWVTCLPQRGGRGRYPPTSLLVLGLAWLFMDWLASTRKVRGRRWLDLSGLALPVLALRF